MSKLLIVGVSEDGPIDGPSSVTTANLDYISSSYGFKEHHKVVLSPGVNTINLNKNFTGTEVKFYESKPNFLVYDQMYFPAIASSGNVLSLGPIPVQSAVTGWIEYSPQQYKQSLELAIKQSLSQNSLTEVEKIDILRVPPDVRSYSTLNFGQFSFNYIYPSYKGNDVRLDISSTGVVVFTPPNIYKTYAYSDFVSLSDLQNQFDTDSSQGISRVNLYVNPNSYNDDLTSSFYPITGSYILTGAVSGTVSPTGYIVALDKIDLSAYDVVVFPGLLGREIFPYLTPFLDNNFPTMFVASASGSTIGQVVNDSVQHRQLVAVYGECYPNADVTDVADLSTSVATVLASDENYYSFGANQVLNVLSTRLPLSPVTLNKYGISTIWIKDGEYRTYKTISTLVNSRTVDSACVRKFLRAFEQNSKVCIGRPASLALQLGEQALKKTLDEITPGSPITEYESQVKIENDTLSVIANFTIVGIVETITVTSAIPLKVIKS